MLNLLFQHINVLQQPTFDEVFHSHLLFKLNFTLIDSHCHFIKLSLQLDGLAIILALNLLKLILLLCFDFSQFYLCFSEFGLQNIILLNPILKDVS
jgi:hypothetical protein